jgi:hypothetical protein
MTATEMLFDAFLYLAFYAGGVASGVFVTWIDNRTKETNDD